MNLLVGDFAPIDQVGSRARQERGGGRSLFLDAP